MGAKAAKDRIYERRPFDEYAVARKLERVKKYRDSDVLIAGCGAGRRVFDRYFEGANLTAVDQSERAIEFVRRRFEDLGVEPPELICADLLEADLPEDAFDHVLCYGVAGTVAGVRSRLGPRSVPPDGIRVQGPYRLLCPFPATTRRTSTTP